LPSGEILDLAQQDAVILSWLALEGPTSRARIAELLWPDVPVEAARNALRQRLFKLKKLYGDALVSGQAILSLSPSVVHDLDTSENLLGDMALGCESELNAWLTQQRTQCRQRAHQSLANQADVAEAQGDFANALRHASALLVHDPLSEYSYQRTMRLHFLRGDRAAALLAFDACERVLKDEVGTTPSAETMALLATIGQAMAAPVASANVHVAMPAGLLRPPRLIGRDSAWESLLQGWQSLALMLVAGEPGMGKTRLLSDLALCHGSTAVLVSARPGDDSVPYALMARLMRVLLARAPQALPKHHMEALARVLPELGQTMIGNDLSALALRDAFMALLLSAQQTGVAGVMLDDLQFVDVASLESIQALYGQSSAMAWILAYRPAELHPLALRLTQEALVESRTVAIQLLPLDEQAVAELVDSLGLARWSGSSLAPALVAHTGGNPLYLLETLKALLREGTSPDGKLPRARNVSQLIAQRLTTLSSQALKIARCAAVAGQDFSPALATQVLGKDPLDLADGWAELESAQVLRDAAFAHDLIHEAALATVPPALARRLHTLIAGALAQHGAAPQRVAAHWIASDAPHEAVPYLLESGHRAALAMRTAEARFAYVKASELLVVQGRESEAFQALMDFLSRMYNAVDADVMDVVHRLESLAQGPQEKAMVAERRADLLARNGDFVGSGTVAIEALGALDLHQHPALEACLLCKASTADLSCGQLDAAVERMHRAIELATRSEDEEAIATTAAYFGSVLDHAHRYSEAYLGHQRALELAHKRQAPIEVISIAANIAGNRMQLGLFDTALEMVQMAYRVSGEAHVDIASQWPSLAAQHALALRGLGEYRKAIRVFEDAQASIAQHMPAWLPGVQNMVAVLWMQLGQWARAKQAIDAALDGSANLPRYRARALLLMAEVMRELNLTQAHSLQKDIAGLTQDHSPLVLHQSGLSRSLTLPADEGYVLACRLRDQGLALQMPNHVLEAEVRCAITAARAGRHDLAASHAREALRRLRDTSPTTLYRGEVWLGAAQAMQVTAPQERAQVLQTASQWVRDTANHRVPEEFRDSFLHRNPFNRDLLALAKCLTAA
jgi:DNA-binding SARP family transcriptional activator